MPNQSPIQAPLESAQPSTSSSFVPARIARLSALDQRILGERKHSLGAGGASSVFTDGVRKALRDEIAEQLREGPFDPQGDDSDVRKWAADIVAAFREE